MILSRVKGEHCEPKILDSDLGLLVHRTQEECVIDNEKKRVV